MKKLLLVLLALPLIGFGQLGEYYKPIGHPKAKGLNFQIKKPLGFEQMEGDRPNIVQKWTKDLEDIDKTITFLILVNNIPKEMQNISQKEWQQYIRFEGGLKELTENVDNIYNAKYYVLDNFPGVYYEGEDNFQRTDKEIIIFYKIAQVFTSKHMFQIQMLTNNKELLKKNESLFNSLANSVILLEQY